MHDPHKDQKNKDVCSHIHWLRHIAQPVCELHNLCLFCVEIKVTKLRQARPLEHYKVQQGKAEMCTKITI